LKLNTHGVEIVPFMKEHFKEAAVLVAGRCRAEYKKNPLIKHRFEEPEAALPCLNRYGESKLGVAAVRNGKVIGFLAPLPILGRGLPAVWIRDWGHGAIAGDRKEIYRMMYTEASGIWIKESRLIQAVNVFTGENDVSDAWTSLAFGRIGVDALLEIPETLPDSPSVNIRKAGPDDLETLVRFRKAMADYFYGPPVLAYTTEDFLWQGNGLFEKQLADSEVAIWLACDNGKPIGCMKVVPSTQEGFHILITGEETCWINMAFTEESYRQKGVATALLNKVLAWAKEKGYTRCAVDFDSPNVLGSRFWLSHFRPVCYVLERRIDFRLSPDWQKEK